MDEEYRPPAWLVWNLDRAHKEKDCGDPIEYGIAICRSNRAQTQAQLAWLEAGEIARIRSAEKASQQANRQRRD